MKIQKLLTLITICSTLLASCANASPIKEAMLKPGDKIGEMVVEKHSMSTRYPDLWDYCAFQSEETAPGTQTIECDVPLIPRMQISIGWGAKESAILDTNWDAMMWELRIDGYQIDLDETEPWSDSGRPDLGVYQYARGWVLDLNNLTPGKHTLKYTWTSTIPIDDGFDVYQPGTYEHIVNFTVAEK